MFPETTCLMELLHGRCVLYMIRDCGYFKLIFIIGSNEKIFLRYSSQSEIKESLETKHSRNVAWLFTNHLFLCRLIIQYSRHYMSVIA